MGTVTSLTYADYIFKNEDEFGKFVTYYYTNPQKEKVIPSINYYVNSPVYEKVDSRMTTAHFYAYILKTDTELTNKLFENQNQSGTPNSKIFTLNILWLVNNDTSKNLIKKAKESWRDEATQNVVAKIEKTPVYDVLRNTPQTAEDLDSLWCVFFATGSEDAIKRIISVLHLREEGHGMEIIIGGAAQWSLTSNAVQHKRVLNILKNEAKKSTGITKKILEEIIKNAEKN